jgi:hypothetical protein
VTPPLVVLCDTREQRPLVFPAGVEVRSATLGEGDYSAEGVVQYARIERKSSGDLWGSVHGDHERFNRELARLGDIPRAAVIVDDAWSPGEVADRMRAPPKDRLAFFGIIRALQWKARVPIVWCGERDAAANYVLWALRTAAEDYAPERLARCAEIARLAGPYASGAGLRAAALAAEFGICAACGRRPGSRPKPPGPGICACGRKA